MSLVRENEQGNVIGLCVRLLFHDLEGNGRYDTEAENGIFLVFIW